ncbi:hypothetical protein [Paenisporosarcina sp. TG20]|uniref:hypothetical protein n=1 Tax=Paenisporosarcina sp. TG20 TaxID=1211706 RepID=UPI0003634F3C|nr:hypothetical protein [Paenisporosarcina sp. TG20]
MSHSDLYNVCCRYHGKNVRITCRDGRVHMGEITRINKDTVWIRPTGNLGGYGYGFFGGYGRGGGYGGYGGYGRGGGYGGYGGYGRGGGYGGYGYGIGLSSIAAIALAAAFLW